MLRERKPTFLLVKNLQLFNLKISVRMRDPFSFYSMTTDHKTKTIKLSLYIGFLIYFKLICIILYLYL